VSDILGDALAAVAQRSGVAYPLAFAAGVSTSIGPCVAPRYVAVSALANASRRPMPIVGAFVAGVIGAYVALGLAFGTLAALWSNSRLLYATLALALGGAGIATLLRSEVSCDRHLPAPRRSASVGGAFLLGASSAFIVAPCCTPIVAAIAGFTTLGGRTAEGVGLLVAFALGHTSPLLAAGALGRTLARLFRGVSLSPASSVVGATLMLALAVYYGVLA
jgi:thiol:disulfide interchange protein DsbD